MKINATVELQKDDKFDFTPDEAAQEIIKALGGDVLTDFCAVVVSLAPVSGTAGTDPLDPLAPPTSASLGVPNA